MEMYVSRNTPAPTILIFVLSYSSLNTHVGSFSKYILLLLAFSCNCHAISITLLSDSSANIFILAFAGINAQFQTQKFDYLPNMENICRDLEKSIISDEFCLVRLNSFLWPTKLFY